MKKLLVLLILAALSGCAGASLDNRYESAVERMHAAHSAYITDPQYAPVTMSFYDKANMNQFAIHTCKLSPDPKKRSIQQKRQCMDRLAKAFYANLSQAYPLANGTNLLNKCWAHQEQCQYAETFEKWARESQNFEAEGSKTKRTRELEFAKLQGDNARFEESVPPIAPQQSIAKIADKLPPPLGPTPEVPKNRCVRMEDGIGNTFVECGK